jgi:pimeloyl-ACP methyl ester carboxylesterase
MEEMAAQTPAADFFAIPKAAHLSNLERPDAFNNAVKGWLDERPAPGR